MDDDTILKIAHASARHIQKYYQLSWTHEDWEDAIQEAAMGVVEALQCKPGMHERYYQTSGNRAVIRQQFRRSSINTLSTDCIEEHEREHGSGKNGKLGTAQMVPIEVPSYGWQTGPLTDEDIPKIRALLSIVPRKPGARGGPKTRDQLAIARDLIILQALSQGSTRTQIAVILGISKSELDPYIHKLRERLKSLAERQGIQK